jgi:hypothetical protein
MTDSQELIETPGIQELQDTIENSICQKSVASLLLIYVAIPIVFINIYFWCKDITYSISAEMYCLCNGVLIGFFCLIATITIMVTGDFRQCLMVLGILFYIMFSALNIIWLILILKQ